MLKKKSNKFFGMYRGKVIDNLDPLQYGRIKVQIYPAFSEIKTSTELPWAKPAFGLSVGSSVGAGAFTVPDINSYVFCFFIEGDIYQPVYFAESPTAQVGLPASRTTNYPNRRIHRTKNGIEIMVDDTAKEIKVTHPTGTYMDIDEDGNVIVYSVGNVIISGSTVSINPL